jgi:hypothetical protein
MIFFFFFQVLDGQVQQTCLLTAATWVERFSMLVRSALTVNSR